jgi:hypothetical protein
MRKQSLVIKIRRASFPVNTWLNSVLPVDYADAFKAEWSSDRYFSSEEMLIAIFCRLPAWLRFLCKIRNMLVKLPHITAETMGLAGSSLRRWDSRAAASTKTVPSMTLWTAYLDRGPDFPNGFFAIPKAVISIA